MSTSIDPVTRLAPNEDVRGSLMLRILTRWKRQNLDAELARGIDPSERPELILRASQLRSPSARSKLATALIRTLDEARDPSPYRFKLQPHRIEIRSCADELLSLARRLEDERPVAVQGVALISQLLTSRESPLDRASGQSLRPALRSARLALDGLVRRDQQDLPVAA